MLILLNFAKWLFQPPRCQEVDKRGQAQAKFHQIVKDACGFAGFVTDPSDVYRIIGRGQG